MISDMKKKRLDKLKMPEKKGIIEDLGPMEEEQEAPAEEDLEMPSEDMKKAPGSDLADISDEDLLAELKKRGLEKQMSEGPAMEEENELI